MMRYYVFHSRTIKEIRRPTIQNRMKWQDVYQQTHIQASVYLYEYVHIVLSEFVALTGVVCSMQVGRCVDRCTKSFTCTAYSTGYSDTH